MTELELIHKGVRTIEDCTSYEQLKVAVNYCELLLKRLQGHHYHKFAMECIFDKHRDKMQELNLIFGN